MAVIYITKWVVTRGIIVARGEPARFSSAQRRNVYRVDLMGHQHRHREVLIVVGSEGFLSQDEAFADAERRFEEHLSQKRRELAVAERAMSEFRGGNLKTWKNPSKIAEVFAFGRSLYDGVDSKPCSAVVDTCCSDPCEM